MYGDKWDEDLSNVSEWFVDSFGFINESQLNYSKNDKSNGKCLVWWKITFKNEQTTQNIFWKK